MAPKLYLSELSPFARSVLMTEAALGIKLDKQMVNLQAGEQKTPEFLKLNPQHTVPTLEDGDYVVWDSHAINAYLVNQYGKDDSLYPKNPKKRGTVDQRLHFNSSILFPHMRSVAKSVRENAAVFTQEQIDGLDDSYGFVNTFLEGRKFIAGDDITIADFSYAAVLTTLNLAIPIDSKKHPKLADWLQRIKALPCYKANEPGLRKVEEFIRNVQAKK